jgi:3-methyladenine DNA glycosylase/8-oxoguanine DNA glycosylase
VTARWTATGPTHPIEIRREVRPPWPFRLPLRNGLDGLARVRNGVMWRLLHYEDRSAVIVRVAQPSADRVVFGASADRVEAAEWAIERMRFALGVDLDLRPFHDRFRFDPLIGASVRSNPARRVYGKPEPFEALAWAVCEQLIEFERAAEIERVMSLRLGHRCRESGLVDSPAATVLAAQAPALLESFGLSPARAVSLWRVAREVASGRVDLTASDPAVQERGWQRLRTIRGVGTWTVSMLALTGQGRMDQIPAGDLGLLKLVGRLRTGDPRARATEEEVLEVFAPYEPWAGLAAVYAMGVGGAVRSGRLNSIAA